MAFKVHFESKLLKSCIVNVVSNLEFENY